MKALVFHNPKHVSVETVKDPVIEDAHNVIVKVTSTAICGSDLHTLHGFVPQAKGLVPGHVFTDLKDAAKGYYIFNKKEDNSAKVILKP